MGKHAALGTTLTSLVKMAMPLCQQAERENPRTGPGRKPEIPDWAIERTDYGRRAQTKKEQILPVPVPQATRR